MPLLKAKVCKPSYMAIKKALYGRQPGLFLVFGFPLHSCLQKSFSFSFSFCALAVAREFSLSLLTGIFNKVPSFTHFGCFKVVIHMRSCRFLYDPVHCFIFHLILVTPKITKFILKLQLFILCMLVMF